MCDFLFWSQLQKMEIFTHFLANARAVRRIFFFLIAKTNFPYFGSLRKLQRSRRRRPCFDILRPCYTNLISMPRMPLINTVAQYYCGQKLHLKQKSINRFTVTNRFLKLKTGVSCQNSDIYLRIDWRTQSGSPYQNRAKNM